MCPLLRPLIAALDDVVPLPLVSPLEHLASCKQHMMCNPAGLDKRWIRGLEKFTVQLERDVPDDQAAVADEERPGHDGNHDLVRGDDAD